MCLTPKIHKSELHQGIDKLNREIRENILPSEINDVCDYIEDLSDIDKHPTDLAVMQLNIRSMVHKVSALESILNGNNSRIDVCALSETWLKSHHNIAIDGYQIESKPCINKRDGGVAIAIHKEILYKRRSDLETHNDDTFECCFNRSKSEKKIDSWFSV